MWAPHPLVDASVDMQLEAKLGTLHCKALNYFSTRKACPLHLYLNVLWYDSIPNVLLPGFANTASIELDVVLAVLLGQFILVSLLT